jgi:hypothetical protein
VVWISKSYHTGRAFPRTRTDQLKCPREDLGSGDTRTSLISGVEVSKRYDRAATSLLEDELLQHRNG